VLALGLKRRPDRKTEEPAVAQEQGILGKLGEFGQPVIRRKADTLLEEFAGNLRAALGA
jgi:carbon monoxide dehydrogenase subunit G